ncbi:hypothetical protein BV898_15377 [Hypsibius exemplaris]|uniref:Uncharacterized protein n=1 Tax=Hypsibius exemplaris TaxID=2072580 RepID=A0A9X6NK41_HYPEX|nr:hypothetical protein BV898_15377 [Hypsibius exemplaris]
MSTPNLAMPSSFLKYSFSVATFTALSWHAYHEYQKKAISGQSWDEIAREKRRNAAATFCSYLTTFHASLRQARDYLRTGRVEEAITLLVDCLEGWQFKKQTLKALKRHLHPEFFARLVNRLVEKRMFDCKDVLGHLAQPSDGQRVGLNMDLRK